MLSALLALREKGVNTYASDRLELKLKMVGPLGYQECTYRIDAAVPISGRAYNIPTSILIALFAESDVPYFRKISVVSAGSTLLLLPVTWE
jgi:hypothetical protein